MRYFSKKTTGIYELLLYLPLGLLTLAGCGTNVENVLFQVASAAGRTVVDSFVTDVVNTVEGVENVDTSGDSGTSVAPGNGSNGVGLDSLVGDSVAGEVIFMDNNCSACHCADGSGGCALSAPSVIGESTQQTDNTLRGSDPHPGGKFNLSDQELVDLVAYLDSL